MWFLVAITTAQVAAASKETQMSEHENENDISAEEGSSPHFEYATNFLRIEQQKEDPLVYEVSFLPDLTTRPHVHGPLHFWREVVRAMRELTGDSSWIIRYASQIDAQNVPAAKSSHANTVLLDLMAPYRSVVKALLIGGKVNLRMLPRSEPYFFKSRDAVNATASARRASRKNRQSPINQPIEE
jgi:hypothetical protein